MYTPGSFFLELLRAIETWSDPLSNSLSLTLRKQAYLLRALVASFFLPSRLSSGSAPEVFPSLVDRSFDRACCGDREGGPSILQGQADQLGDWRSSFLFFDG